MPNHRVNFTAAQWAIGAQMLVETDDPDAIRQFEIELGCSQEEAVNHFIEASCCSDDLPGFVGGRGTPQQRLAALRALWREYSGAEETADA